MLRPVYCVKRKQPPRIDRSAAVVALYALFFIFFGVCSRCSCTLLFILSFDDPRNYEVNYHQTEYYANNYSSRFHCFSLLYGKFMRETLFLTFP